MAVISDFDSTACTVFYCPALHVESTALYCTCNAMSSIRIRRDAVFHAFVKIIVSVSILA